ncbi:MAG: ParB/RepB/Spo0J family partition protein [Bacillota bacterium]
MSLVSVMDLFKPVELPVDSLTMRPGAEVPGGLEYVTRRLLGDLVRGSSDPVLVRPMGTGFEIIAGDVDYLAAKKRGNRTVKAMVGEIDDKDSLLLRLLEGSRRGDLNPMEEAEIIRELNGEFGLTQQEIAMRSDRVQSTVANKMRLLKLPADVQDSLRHGEIGERHARALLKLVDPVRQSEVFKRALRMKASAAVVESMCDLAAGGVRIRRGRGKTGKGIIKDLRIYQNSLRSVVREMKKAGLTVICDEESSENVWEFKVQVRTEDSF